MSSIRGKSETELLQNRNTLLSERLLAYREDLAEWFAGLFSQNITENTFMADMGMHACLGHRSLRFTMADLHRDRRAALQVCYHG